MLYISKAVPSAKAEAATKSFAPPFTASDDRVRDRLSLEPSLEIALRGDAIGETSGENASLIGERTAALLV